MRLGHAEPSRLAWWSAGILTMAADIAGTLAQFLPMKSVFILAADEIPDFFPQFLIDAGPILTGLALVAIAAVMAVVSKVTKNLALSMAEPSQPFPRSSTPSASEAHAENSFGSKTIITVKELSSLILLAVLLVVSAAVSPTFVLLVGLWIGGSAAVLAVRVHRGARKPPYPNGRVEFNMLFKKWMNDSAIWAVVGAAIATLVVAFPPMGLTGILLGAVLLRRAQQAVPDVVPWLMSQVAPVDKSTAIYPDLSRPILSPYDFLATKPGARLLRNSLKALNYDPDSWEVCAQPNNIQMTIACKSLETHTTDLIRLFSPNSERAREHEWALRHDFRDFLPSHVESMSLESIAEMPAIVLKFPQENQPLLDEKVTPQEAMDWQLDWEVRCATSELAQQLLADYEVPDPRDFLYPLLHTASRINGPHKDSVQSLLNQFDQLRKLYLEGPKVLSAGGTITGPNLLRLDSGQLEIVNLTGWRVELLGSEWGDSPAWLSALEKRAKGARETFGSDWTRGRQLVQGLMRASKSRLSPKIETAARELRYLET